MINQNLLLAGDDAYNIQRSLRFRSSASAYLNRTPASASNRTTWTYSTWVKRGALGSVQTLLMAGASGTDYTQIYFNSTDTLVLDNKASNVNAGRKHTSAVYRDPSAWYHAVVAFDTSNATANDRIILYVNGSRITSYLVDENPSSSQVGQVNNNAVHNISKNSTASVQYIDGYLTEVNFIDGQALTPSSFGETDALTGVWKPKKYAGTYGTNGFYLPFTDVATTSGSNAGLGKDFSGNGNYWNTNNISVTAGTTYDSMTDVPTMSALGSNYCVMNPLRPSSYGAATLSDGNLKVSQSAGAYVSSTSTMPMSSGKWYWEVTCTSIGFVTSIGIASTISANGAGASGTWCYHYDGTKYVNGSNSAYGASYTSGDVLGFAYDASAGSLTCYKNGTSQGVLASGLTITDYYAFATLYGTWNISYNFGQRPFAYTPPTGFVALNTFNLPEPSIKQGNKHFDALLWTGDGASPKSRTGYNFAPDFVWTKGRSAATDNALFDIVRGTGAKVLESNMTDAENNYGLTVDSFDANGFTTSNGSFNHSYANSNGTSYVGWAWKANGTGSSNTAGSITSQVSANPTAGFSVVTYTGNGSGGATIGHGLGVAPKMYIVKRRDSGAGATNWYVYNVNLNNGTNPAQYYLQLQSTSGQGGASSIWNDTAPTSSVFSVGTSSETNGSGGTFVAYCWAEIAGFSSFGRYTGNGSADGAFIYTGFVPKFVMIKISSGGSGNWEIFDTARNTYNQMDLLLLPSSSNAESNAYGSYYVDFTANGFKVRGLGAGFNGSGETLIYAAFAETPTKYSLAR